MLNKLGLDNFFGSKSCIDLTLAEYKINIYYKSIWTTSVENLPKLRTYRLFKQGPSTEKYIILNLSRHERSLLAQLRCGILQLRIETGRYIGEPLSDRVCVFCNENVIENESHFVSSCSFYQDLRGQVFGDILNVDLTPDEKLIVLMLNHERKLSKFIVKALFLRRRSIYS